MRKIEKEMIAAIKGNYWFTKNNTEVRDGDEIKVYLHNNLIAKITNEGLFISNCTWYTNTTKSRLNAILHYFNLPGISQIKGKWWINGVSFEEFNCMQKPVKV